MDRILTTQQVVPRSRDVVFAFFSEPSNLEAITPHWLRFRIVDQSTERIEEGTEILYRLRLRGFPVTWRTRIDQWRPNERFVDVQLKGPYSRWHHTHSFHDTDSGTLIRDRVLYRLPLGRLGHWLGGRIVTSDVTEIFQYRAKKTAELLGPLGGDSK